MPVPEQPSKTPDPQVEPTNVPAVRHLVRLMKRYDLTALDFIEGSTQIRLRRRGHEAAPTGYAYPPLVGYAPPPPAYLPNPTSIPSSTPSPPVTVAAPSPSGVVIESPMVGTYYSSNSPEAPSFVSVGSIVRPDATVCIIEAMKVFTDIPAGVSGTITEVLVKSGQPVEYGQALFRVNPA